MLKWMASWIGRKLADYLTSPIPNFRQIWVTDPERLRLIIRPGDVLLVEGKQRISNAIKYLTQSTWSHAALHIGDALGPAAPGEEPGVLVEANLKSGVTAVPLSKYDSYGTRICRPAGLSEEDRAQLVEFAVSRIGNDYDLDNVIDLMRYLLPNPPVPVRWRRRMIALGSGDPTRAICTSLIAEAFQSIHYPILPETGSGEVFDPKTRRLVEQEILHIRHHSLFVPRDFDVSPYFQILKPTIEWGFDYRKLTWADTREETTPETTGAETTTDKD